jgi:hypothetical protein
MQLMSKNANSGSAIKSAYEECLSATTTSDSPWYGVPTGDKENAQMTVSQIVLDTLDELKMSYPETSEARRQELLTIGKGLEP